MRRFCTRLATTAAVLAALAAGGCDDTATAPTALLLAEETEAALQMALELPTLPSLVDRALAPDSVQGDGARTGLEQARTLWLEAEAASGSADREALREAAYSLAAPHLARAIDADELLQLQDTLRRWIRVASSVSGVGSVMGIADALDDARVMLDAAGKAEPTDHRGAVEATLRAADRLMATTPRAVAIRLTTEAETRLAAEGTRDDGLDASSLERADRLVRGAREAVQQREYLLAIRRAYYAGQLLDGR